MNYFNCKRVENCFSKTAIFQYQLTFKIDDLLLSQFEQVGIVKCHRNFPRPYFNISLADGTEIKGVIGDVALKVIFGLVDTAKSKELFEALLTQIAQHHQRDKE